MALSNVVFNVTDHFAEADDRQGESKRNFIHIRIQQRNGRKSLTTVQGLASDLDLKKIVKYLKKIYSTNGTILKDEECGEVIQLQGDQRQNVYEFMTKYKVCTKDEIKVHGF